MDEKKANMVFTDPPYGVSYTGGHNKKKRKGIIADELEGEDLSTLFEDSINNACIFSEPNAPFYIWYADRVAKETYKGLNNTPIQVRAVICWHKVKSGSGAFMSQYIPNYEPCIYGHKEGESIQWFGPTDEKTVWEFPKDKQNEFHPTQKPIDVVSRALNNSSSKEQLVYDAFGGSGSTMVASHQLNRKCCTMELDPKYCQVITDRMKALDSDLVIKINGKDYE
jgi:site-specific DNA-methyltransferase (adenine-specific)